MKNDLAQVQIKNVGEQTVLLLMGISTKETIGQDMDAIFGKVFAYVGGAGIQPIGPPLSLYYTEPGPNGKSPLPCRSPIKPRCLTQTN